MWTRRVDKRPTHERCFNTEPVVLVRYPAAGRNGEMIRFDRSVGRHDFMRLGLVASPLIQTAKSLKLLSLAFLNGRSQISREWPRRTWEQQKAGYKINE